MTRELVGRDYARLLTELAAVIDDGRRGATRWVNAWLVGTYWLIGRRIVLHEQEGRRRASYGEALLKGLGDDLRQRFGRGFGAENLRRMRAFYLVYPSPAISTTVSRKLVGDGRLLDGATPREPTQAAGGPQEWPLSWSHYCLLLRVDEPEKRSFYESECIRGRWSVRQLDRQIQTLLFERTAFSKKRLSLLGKADSQNVPVRPEDEIKDPYVLEFLDLPDEFSELDLEDALIRHLERFLLELGVGFTFVARQKRLNVDGRHYRIDLLFYHRVLRCLVAVDLKVGELDHADAGQMNLYLNYLKDREKLEGESDPVGLILCSSKRETVVRYALGGLSNRVFASTYELRLPDLRLLKEEIEQERRRMEEQRVTVRMRPGQAGDAKR